VSAPPPKTYRKHHTTFGLPKRETTRVTLRNLKAALAAVRNPYADWREAMTEDINRGANLINDGGRVIVKTTLGKSTRRPVLTP